NQIICNCHFTSKYIAKTYKKTTDVIYNGTDSKIFSPPENYSKKRSILTLADVQIRRADFLLNAANKLSKKRKDFKIWIVGNKGQNDIILRNLVQKYNLGDMVEFFGTVYDDSKLARIYSESLVLAHLVKESSFGGTAAEAMACQTPVIAWKPSGLEELIEDGINGFNIEENNYEILIEHIEKFLDNPQLSTEMGKRARTRVQNMIERDEKYKEVRDLLQSWVIK
ncbi:MAG: glycosyltransferase family 4 protein, partial [Nitrosopumilaceae archaeon]